jgi:hypothetical protein
MDELIPNGSSNNQYDGYVKIINGFFAASATTTTTAANFTANAVANVDALYAAIQLKY